MFLFLLLVWAPPWHCCRMRPLRVCDFTLYEWSCRVNDPLKQTFRVLCLHLSSYKAQEDAASSHCLFIGAPLSTVPPSHRRRTGSAISWRTAAANQRTSFSSASRRERAVERTRAQATGRKTTWTVRDTQLWFCEFDEKVSDYDARWLTLNVAFGLLLFIYLFIFACFGWL